MLRCLGPLRWPLAALVAAGVLMWDAPPVRAQRAPSEGAWLTWGGDHTFTRYSPLAAITKDNVKDLQVVWRWQSADRELQASNPLWRAGRNEETPLMVNGTLYTITGLGLIAALDPATGATRWVHDPESYKVGGAGGVSFVQRSVAYWTDGTDERVLAGTNDAYLVSVDAKTGKPDPAFGDRGQGRPAASRFPGGNRAHRQVAARRPLIAGNVVVMGSSINDGAPNKEMPPGYVQAFDVRTGKPLWRFHTVPRAGEFGFDTWEASSAEYSGNSNVWAGMAYDPELDYVYLPSSTPTNDYYGGHRLGDNLFAESLVCVEAKTGKPRLALPGRAPRALGLRLPGDAGARRHHRRRPAHQGRDAAEQAGVPLRVRSQDRRAGVADRGAAGAAVDRSRRTDLADAAVSDQAARLRSPGDDRGDT